MPVPSKSPGPQQPIPTDAPRIPKLLRFLSLHLAMGIAASVFISSALILVNVSNLKDLLVGAQQPFLAIFLLYAFNALTFGSVAMGIGIMTLPFDEFCDMREPGDREE